MTRKLSWITTLVICAVLAVSAQAQTQPSLGGQQRGGGSNPDAQFVVVPMKHVYVGGIAQLFRGNVGTISTEQFVVPASAGQGGGGNRGGVMNARGGGNNNLGGNRGGRTSRRR